MLVYTPVIECSYLSFCSFREASRKWNILPQHIMLADKHAMLAAKHTVLATKHKMLATKQTVLAAKHTVLAPQWIYVGLVT